MKSAAFTYDYVSLTPDRQIGRHVQPTWELAYVICGGGVRTIGNCTEPIVEGEVILIPPHIPHVWNFSPSVTDPVGNIVNIAVFFGQTVLDGIEILFSEMKLTVDRLRNLAGAVSYKGKAREHIGSLLLSMRGLTPESRLPMMIEMLELISHTDNTLPIYNRGIAGKTEQRLEKIRVFCACNFARDIRLDDVARYIGMNKSAFCTFMRRHSGKTFSEYLNCYRLEKAVERLKYTDDGIAEIAYSVGFSNVSYFNRLFRHRFGRSPKTMREST